jgi:plasmid stabilization system protein ParE
MYRIVILPLAAEEIINAVKWYEEKSSGLGEKFRESLLMQIDKLKNDFIEYGSVYKGLSRILLKYYPYVVYFKKDFALKVVTVYAVLHKKQDRSSLL